MNQKVTKYKSDLLKQEATVTIDDSLNKLKGKVFAARKLADANKALRKLKHVLPA
jgi:hypothetical protein